MKPPYSTGFRTCGELVLAAVITIREVGKIANGGQMELFREVLTLAEQCLGVISF